MSRGYLTLQCWARIFNWPKYWSEITPILPLCTCCKTKKTLLGHNVNHITLNSKNSSTETKNIFLRLLTNTFLTNNIYMENTKHKCPHMVSLSSSCPALQHGSMWPMLFLEKAHAAPFFRFPIWSRLQKYSVFFFSSPRYFFFSFL